MATLLFAAAGSALGAGFGGTVLGLSGAVIGRAVGAMVGSVIDQKLLGGSTSTTQEGTRLESLDLTTSTEGAALSDIAGRVAVSGEVIWAAKLKEVENTSTQTAGSGKSKSKVKTTTYSYYASFAVSLGEGPLETFGRVWLDSELYDLSDLLNEGRVRFYRGTEDQEPDPLMVSIEGDAPAYRGTAYILFEDLPLEEFGNRVPQVKVEVWGRSGVMECLVRGVNVIPGTTEWGYSPEVVQQVDVTYSQERKWNATTGAWEMETVKTVTGTKPENAARFAGVSDWSVSMDTLRAVLPETKTASLVVAWFGTDLRAGQCLVEPRVELRDKETEPAWTAGGLSRAAAHVVSSVGGVPSYGSSPADGSVIAAIKDLRARGFRVVLYPFLMMDVRAAQALPAPDGAGVQPDFPWRGRIMPDAAASVAAEVSAFLGAAGVSDFAVSGEEVTYSGPDEWRFRRFILHLAHLAKAAGGVDAILVGSELRGLTMAPGSAGGYPFVEGLRDLAADVSAVLPDALVGYAADWSEYHSHREGSDVIFHLDPLWADPNVDFVGIDNYLPLSDWRSGADHADAALAASPYALDYLKSNVEGGEYWDFYYASEEDRAAQVRTPIYDGAHGEDWIYRQKAIREWHGNPHHNRPGGVRDAAETAWVPGSKPVWFTELGCPAVNLGANQPNVFVSRLSSESAVPWFSDGSRDDFMQRQFLRAALEWWRDNGAGVVALDDVQIWCWDARPWPEFPQRSGMWADGPDWTLGHWLNGRAGAAPAAEAIERRLVEYHGLTAADFDLSAAYGQADGYASDAPVSFRDWFTAWENGLGLQSFERGGGLSVESRAAALTVGKVTVGDMVDVEGGSPFTAVRSAIEDVTAAAIFRFKDGSDDYETTAVRAMISMGREEGTSSVESPLVLDFERGFAAVERILRAASDGRETLTFGLPRSATDIRPGVIVPVDLGGGIVRQVIVERITEGESLAVEAKSFSRSAWSGGASVSGATKGGRVQGSSALLVRFLDLPKLPGSSANAWDGAVAAHAAPWPGSAVVSRASSSGGDYGAPLLVEARATMGETVGALAPDRAQVWTEGPLTVRLYAGEMVGRADLDVLAGRNMIAVGRADGWEVIQFREAELVGANEYRLTGLLRGQRGTDALARTSLPEGAPVVVLDAAVEPLGLTEGERGRGGDRWRRAAVGRAGLYGAGPRAEMAALNREATKHAPARAGVFYWKGGGVMDSNAFAAGTGVAGVTAPVWLSWVSPAHQFVMAVLGLAVLILTVRVKLLEMRIKAAHLREAEGRCNVEGGGNG